jgi:hypothetical protein
LRRFRRLTFATVTALAGFVPWSSTLAEVQERADRGGKAPTLRPLTFRPLPLGSIRPSGWLLSQLKIQAGGLSGHLDEFWPDIKNSAWTGGNAEGWERAPYWLDGIVPLAFLLDDEALKSKARRFFDYVLAHQRDDGWLGPVSDGKHAAYDPWPLFVLFKAMTQYQEATGDPRVVPAIQRCLRKIDEVISKQPLTSWAHFRSADLVLTLYWLYDHNPDPWLLELAAKVQRQGFDWGRLFADFPFKSKTRDKFELDTHGVNTAMGLKQPGVRYRLAGDPKDRDAIFPMLEQLDRYHGQATGVFTCDEHLAGRSPSQGTELCTVVEEMFSLEELISILGKPALGDRLERITFNALPATFKPDMCAHQYDQQANQVLCRVSDDRVYVNNGPDANLFGLEPNFGCCTANMHQGWPKFATHLWMRAPDDGLVATAYAPSVVETKLGGQTVRVELETDYPFNEMLTFTVRANARVRFPLLLRIPAWAQGAQLKIGDEESLSGSAGDFHRIDREWEGSTKLTLRLPMPVTLWQGEHRSVAIERGPLVFALRVGDYWKKVKGEPPFADWEVYPETPWNFAIRIDREHPEQSIRFESKPMSERPFSPDGAPLLARLSGRVVPWWTLEKNAAAPPPESPVRSDQPLQELVMLPYGCTSLRVTEFPTLADP